MIETDEFPFSGLQNDDFLNEFVSLNSSLEPNIIRKMTGNITFNPFSLNGSGKKYLTSSPNTDQDENYFNQFIYCLIWMIVITMMKLHSIDYLSPPKIIFYRLLIITSEA